MRIEQIKESQRKKGRLLVRLEDGNVLRVTEEELLRFGLRAGMELDEETAETISALMGVKEKHGKLCKPRHHPKYSRTAKAFPVFAK